MPQDLTDDKSTLVQVMALCRQATSHYLNQCWHRSLSPYGVTRPQWVNFAANAVSADGLVPAGVRSSAGTMMTKSASDMCTGPHLNACRLVCKINHIKGDMSWFPLDYAISVNKMACPLHILYRFRWNTDIRLFRSFKHATFEECLLHCYNDVMTHALLWNKFYINVFINAFCVALSDNWHRYLDGLCV